MAPDSNSNPKDEFKNSRASMWFAKIIIAVWVTWLLYQKDPNAFQAVMFGAAIIGSLSGGQSLITNYLARKGDKFK